jgi:hypothetical protein
MGNGKRVRLISFGAGSEDYRNSARRVVRQSRVFREITESFALDEQHLDSAFRKAFARIDPSASRGFGFWAWKPYLVRQHLQQLEYGDILIYLDGGAEVNPKGHSRFIEYLDITAQRGFLCFAMPYQHRNWCKKDPMLELGPEFYFRNQLSAAFFMLLKTEQTVKLVDLWYELASASGGKLLQDGDTSHDQLPDFKEHRHDQALLTVAAFKLNLVGQSPDETYFDHWPEAKKFPFLLLRNRTGESVLNYRLSSGPRKFMMNVLMPFLARNVFKYHVRNIVRRLFG